MKKNIFITLVLLFVLQIANSQSVFIYNLNGEKEYFIEIDSLFQIKFLEEPDISLKNQLNSFFSIKEEEKTAQRIVVKFNREDKKTLSLIRGNKRIKYINQSLMNSKGSILIPTDKIMVRIKSGNNLSDILQKLNISYESLRKLGSDANSFLITLLDGNSITVANKLFESGFFELSQPSFTSFEGIQNPFYTSQWGFNNTGQNNGTSGIDINAPEAWNITRGHNNIRIAVIDQGVDLLHPDLANNLLLGFDATDGIAEGINGNCSGNDAHGTACAGIISSINNTIGTIGVAPHCRIIPIRVTYTQNEREIWDDDWTVSAMHHAWAVSNVDVISCSWRQGRTIPLLDTEISNALTQGRQGRGCIVVFAAGNFNSAISYPANSNPSILAIGAISQCGERKRSSSNIWETNPGVSTDPLGVSCDGEKWWGSNWGSQLDIVAPGVKIYTTDIRGNAGYNPPQQGSDINNRDYTSLFNGTSAATPHVAGVAALILSVRPDLTGQQVRNVIEQTAQKVGGYSYATTSGRPNGTWNQEMGYGLVDAYAAVYAVAPRLSGPASVCNQATYTIKNLPQGATVQWSASNNSMTLQSGQGTATALFRQTGLANSEIRAAIRFNGATIANLAQAITVCQPFLSGPSAICNQATYTVENLPVGLQVQWQVHPGLHVYGQTNNSISVSKQSLTSPIEKGWVKATIVGTNTTFRKDNILVWKSGTTQTNDLLVGQLDASGGQVEAVYPIQELGRNFQWSASNNWQAMIQGYHFTDFSGIPQSGASSVYITVRFDDPCGSETIIYKEFELPSTYSFSLSPNPVTDVTTLQWKLSGEAISMNSNSQVTQAVVWNRSPYEIQLWSGMTMLRSFRTNEPTFQISMAGLPAGLYFVRVVKNGQTYTQKLIKK